MPPTTRRSARRTVSAPSTPPNNILQFGLFGPTHAPISPVLGRSRRVHSASSSPYPTTRQAIGEARTTSRTADTSRRILGEIDWWVRMSGQRDEEEDDWEFEEDEEEEEEWETMPEEDAQAREDNAPSAPVDIMSHIDKDDDDETISEHSDSETTLKSDAPTLTGYEASDGEEEESLEVIKQRSASLLFFPTNFPPLTNLLSAQVGQEPSRRAPSRPYATRATTSLTWDYSTSSMMITSNVGSPSPPPSPGRTTIRRTSPRRASSITPGSIADGIIREALAPSSPPPPGPTKTNLNFLPLKKFPVNLLMTSPSIMTYR